VGSRVVGLLVDAVSDVVNLTVSGMDLAPELGARVDTSYISGMGRAGDKFIIVLAIDKIVAGVDATARSYDSDPSHAGGDRKPLDPANRATHGSQSEARI